MRKLVLYLLIWIIAGLMLIACQRDRGVYAGNDEYQPRSVPQGPAIPEKAPRDIRGELLQVDAAHKTFSVRVENGMAQTFKFDHNTTIMGLDNEYATMRDLVGKEGSELAVRWQDSDDVKLATNVDVKQISTAKSTRRSRKH